MGGKSPQTPFLYPLESLRGIAALLVVVYHMYWMNPLYGMGFVRNGALMVDLFFVLSGFVMYYVYGTNLGSKKQVNRFVWLRLWRLIPLHYAMLLVFLGIEFVKYLYVVNYGGSFSDRPPFTTNNFTSFVNHLLLIHSMGFQSMGTFNSPSWSISVEFFAYLAFAGLSVLLPSNLRIAGFTLVVAASFAGILLTGHNSLTFDYHWSFFRCTYGFFIGVIASWFFSRKAPSFANGKFSEVLLWVLLLALVAVLMVKRDNYVEFFVPPIVAFFVFMLSSNQEFSICRLLERSFFQWLGKVSYSIYMTHMAVLWVISVFLQKVLKIERVAVNGEEILATSPMMGTASTIVSILFVLAVSSITYRFIEKPFRSLGRRLWKEKEARRSQQTESRIAKGV